VRPALSEVYQPTSNAHHVALPNAPQAIRIRRIARGQKVAEAPRPCQTALLVMKIWWRRIAGGQMDFDPADRKTRT